MTVYASISADGFPVAYFPDNVFLPTKDGKVHVDIPSDVVRLADGEFRELIDNAGRRKVVGGKVVKHEPQVAPEDVEVTNHQLRLALDDAGKFKAVDEAVTASGNVRAMTSWHYANAFKRSAPFVKQLQALLRMTAAEVDALFEAASRIQ